MAAMTADQAHRAATPDETAAARHRWQGLALGPAGIAPLEAFTALLESTTTIRWVDADHWPLRDVVACDADATVLEPGAVVAVSQRQVRLERVQERTGLRDAGPYRHDAWIGALRIARLDSGLYLFDGHHALAARAILGLPLVAWIYDGSDDGPRRMSVPRLA